MVNLSLDSPDGLIAQNVMLASAVHGGSNATRVVLAGDAKPGEAPNFAMVSDLDFTDGTIEVEVAGLTLPDGPPQARGFIGFVFRIAEDFIGFEGLYIRPTNGRADDQLRRNHAVQYFSYPDYGWKRLRDEAHRVAVTYHRSARASRDFRSELDDIPGVGARRRKVLLTRFGSVANVRRATREELVPVVGARVADAVLRHFADGSRERTDLP